MPLLGSSAKNNGACPKVQLAASSERGVVFTKRLKEECEDGKTKEGKEGRERRLVTVSK